MNSPISFKRRQRGDVLVQILLVVGIAVAVLFYFKRQSVGTLVIHNASSQKLPQIVLHGINPATQSIVDTVTVADIDAGQTTEVSLETLQWHQVTMELCRNPGSPVAIPSRSAAFNVLPGGSTLKAELMGETPDKLQVSSWEKE
jgi:hypothetical protein